MDPLENLQKRGGPSNRGACLRENLGCISSAETTSHKLVPLKERVHDFLRLRRRDAFQSREREREIPVRTEL